MVESSGLLNRRTALKRYRGFESLPLRQSFEINRVESVPFLPGEDFPSQQRHVANAAFALPRRFPALAAQ